jgi:CarD family transcriptional regulator
VASGSPSPETSELGARVGDEVVYAAHGIGHVVARERRQVGATKRECVVIDLATGLRVTLVVEDAVARLRAVADTTELEVVRKTLGARSSGRDGSWARRIKESEAKLAAGQATDLAEIVRDGGRVERADGGRLSFRERRLYRQARRLLVSELCSARGVDEDAAEAWIDAEIHGGSED